MTPYFIELIPITDSNESIDFLLDLFRQTKQENLDYIFEGSILNEFDFIHAMFNDNTLFFLLYYEGILVGYFWIDTFVGRSCFIHFCFFRHFWGKQTISFGHKVMRYLFDYFNFDMIAGLVPITNNFAIKYAEQVMNKVGIFPKSIYNPEKDEHKDAVLFYLCKGEVKNGE